MVTAAHCVTPQLTAVVLGEHDRAATFDCLDPDLGCDEPDTLACVEAEQCAPASQTVPISQVKVQDILYWNAARICGRSRILYFSRLLSLRLG